MAYEKMKTDFEKQEECENSCIENERCVYIRNSHGLFWCIERKPYLVCPYFTIKKEE